jgi:peptidoglycan glycosyltransferase
MRDLMIQVVKNGTGTAAAIQGVQVAGKTGTAEVANGEPHAWFAAFAPADNPQVVVAVLVENAGTGGSVAAPIARQVIAAALGL